nr:protein disulfide isomerase-like 5-4 [Tanacetum cinerariifolium]
QVVKTEVLGLSHQLIEDYEYTAHTSLIHSHSIPAAKFHLHFSPMQVLITETAKPFSHFITNLCAIIGGVFTVAGILDSILYNTCKLAQKTFVTIDVADMELNLACIRKCIRSKNLSG